MVTPGAATAALRERCSGPHGAALGKLLTKFIKECQTEEEPIPSRVEDRIVRAVAVAQALGSSA